MSEYICPLCKGSNIKIIETIRAKDVNDLYFDSFQLEIMYLFKEDKIFFCKCKNCALKFFKPSAIGDEYFYNILQKTDLYYMDNKEEYDIAAKYINPSDDVLDIGCGKGAFAKKIKYKTYTGLELSTNAKKLGEEEGVNIINQSIQDYSIFNKEKYNVVCTFQVLEHVDTNVLADFLKAAVDCLKPNGLLIISVPSDDSFVSKMVNNPLNLPPHHQTRWPDQTLKEIAKIFNLAIVDVCHDALAARYKAGYFRIIGMYLLTIKHRLINKKINILQKIALRLINLLSQKPQLFIINRISPRGHSITAIYRKTA